MGIDFQDILIIVHAVTLIGTEYVHQYQGEMILTQIWNNIEICYPLQVYNLFNCSNLFF